MKLKPKAYDKRYELPMAISCLSPSFSLVAFSSFAIVHRSEYDSL